MQFFFYSDGRHYVWRKLSEELVKRNVHPRLNMMMELESKLKLPSSSGLTVAPCS